MEPRIITLNFSSGRETLNNLLAVKLVKPNQNSYPSLPDSQTLSSNYIIQIPLTATVNRFFLSLYSVQAVLGGCFCIWILWGFFCFTIYYSPYYYPTNIFLIIFDAPTRCIPPSKNKTIKSSLSIQILRKYTFKKSQWQWRNHPKICS